MISPGLEDVESLDPGESAPALLGWVDVKDIVVALLQVRVSMDAWERVCYAVTLPGSPGHN